MIMIELRGICFSYDSSRLLYNVDIAVGQHDFLGVVGRNGSGKTTLLKIIMGMLAPHSGRVVLRRNGKVTPRLSIGYLPQYSRIDKMFPITVRETVELGLLDGSHMLTGSLSGNHRRAAVDDAMLRMEITALADKPIGLLSGGELQRTMLARAVVSHPDLLVLDEPDTYLDARSENRLHCLLKELNRDCAIILVGHDVKAIAANATHVAFVGTGCVKTFPVSEITDELLVRFSTTQTL